MTDITIVMMSEDSPVAESPARWRRGEIVEVFPRERMALRPGGRRNLHIHVTGVPFAFEKIKARLTEGHDPDPDGRTYRARRRFVGRGDLMPVSARQQLNENRYIEVTWEQAKQFARKRRIGSLDPEDAVTDADFNDILLANPDG